MSSEKRKKSVMVSVRFATEELVALRAEAERLGVSLSALVRAAAISEATAVSCGMCGERKQVTWVFAVGHTAYWGTTTVTSNGSIGPRFVGYICRECSLAEFDWWIEAA